MFHNVPVAVVEACGFSATSAGRAPSALATMAMLVVFRTVGGDLQAIALLSPATSAAPTINLGVDASVQMVLMAMWNGQIPAGRDIAARPSVKYQTQIKIQVWHANATMASVATSRGMVPMQGAAAFRLRATSRTPTTSRALAASVPMALMEILRGRVASLQNHANLLHVALQIPQENLD